MEKFVITKNANDEFQFCFIDKNGDTILRSSGYTRKFMCEKGVQSVKSNSQDSSKFFKKTISNDKVYFNLKAFNGKIIGMSKIYEDRILRDKGIEFLKNNAPSALVEDQTKSSDKYIKSSSLVY
ncbi:YegP family protein [Flavobacterium sp. ALJ2]|uniref:YegP family protein n=1 Tax=Flavobacterium sp. ALJ2 TaxID=2786960 RepID=UPI0018A0A60B|nr:YegP family protein [Flavobacterium sp. ALJ2]MBF7091615.1 YegP family protein [Flavobacterium sp. ALJ2]